MARMPAEKSRAPRRAVSVDDPAETEWGVPPIRPDADLPSLGEAMQHCRACPIYRQATQAVPGEGRRDARIVLLGEQPGDQEDRTGRPFVGPAGQLLERALQSAGLARADCYVTNTVKHFKWEPRGKRRLHARPSPREIAVCQAWAEAELQLIRPLVLVCLGATAAQFVFGRGARIERDRGQLRPTAHAPCTLITIHPSALLRIREAGTRQASFERLVEDLRIAARAAHHAAGRH